MRSINLSFRRWLCALVSILLCTVASGQEQDEMQQLWHETYSLLQRREYSLAVNLLENRLDDSEFFRYTKRIQQDLDAIERIKSLSDSVKYAVKKLPPSTPLTILSKDYLFERYDTNESGIVLVLNHNGNRQRNEEFTVPLSRLDSATWLQIAESEIAEWSDTEFVIGIFLAFDRYPNVRVARTQLNQAADSGHDVAVWIRRLEEAEQERKQKSHPGSGDPTAKDLLLGKWTVVIKGGRRLVWEFNRGGDGFAYVKDRRFPAKWEEESEGVFRFSNRNGGTAVINVSGNRIFGKLANGVPFRGVRHAN